MTSPFADASHSQDFLPGLGAVGRSNCEQLQWLLCCSSRSWTTSIFPFSIHCCSRFCSAVCPD